MLRNTSMGGQVTVTFQREPSFFAAAAVEGGNQDVLTVRDAESNRLVGLGVCSVRDRYVQGRPQCVGYLSALRILPEFRSFGLLCRGYRALRELPLVKSASFHVTTVAEGNQRAIDLLTSGRVGLPFYDYLGRYFTFALSLRPQRGDWHGIEVRPATTDDRDMIVPFLNSEGRTVNLFPCYGAADFFQPDATFKNLSPESISLAFRGGALAGVMGAWDQSRFRQVVVESYDPLRRFMRPAYNAWARIRGMPTFPPAGHATKHLFAALPVIRGGEASIASALIGHLKHQSSRRQHTTLMIGAFERDPLCSWLKRQAVFSYVTRVYVVSWDRNSAALQQLADQNLYLELGCL